MYSGVMRLGVLEIGVLRLPVVALLVKQTDEIEQLRVAGAVVEPDGGEGVVLPAEFSPVAQRARGQRFELMGEVASQDGDDARIACGFLILLEGLEHDHARPPIVIACGPDHAVRGLVGQRPVDVFLRLGLETSVVEQLGEWDEAIEEVWPAFPGFSGATEPAAVGADVGPGFVEVSAEASRPGFAVARAASPLGGLCRAGADKRRLAAGAHGC